MLEDLFLSRFLAVTSKLLLRKRLFFCLCLRYSYRLLNYCGSISPVLLIARTWKCKYSLAFNKLSVTRCFEFWCGSRQINTLHAMSQMSRMSELVNLKSWLVCHVAEWAALWLRAALGRARCGLRFVDVDAQ